MAYLATRSRQKYGILTQPLLFLLQVGRLSIMNWPLSHLKTAVIALALAGLGWSPAAASRALPI